MNKTTADDLTTEERNALELWAANARDAYEALSIPMVPGDERLLYFRGHRLAGPSPELLGQMWAQDHLELEWPLPRPSWAVEVVTEATGYPEVTVSFAGRAHTSGEHSAWIAADVTYVVDDHVNPNGAVDHRGEMDVSPIVIRHSAPGDELSPAGALAVARVLQDAFLELRDAEDR